MARHSNLVAGYAFCLVEGSGGAADDAIFAFSELSEDCAEACGRLARV